MEHAQDHNKNHQHELAATATATTTTGTNGGIATPAATDGSTSGRSALILLAALAVHSILEMAALGLADSFPDSAILTLSIALHQVRPFRLLTSFFKMTHNGAWGFWNCRNVPFL